jgi:hypothetical protein
MSHVASTWARRARVGNVTNKAILFVLADYANHNHECWPSFERVAYEAECSISTVKRAIADMEKRGILRRERRRRPDGTLGSYLMVLSVQPEVNLTDGQPETNVSPGPELNLTSGQSDLRSNTTPTRAQFELAEPCKLEPLEEAAAAAVAPAPARDPWRDRLAEAHAVLGPAANLTAGGLHTWGPLKALCEPKTGPPCAWDDVLDALRQIAARFQAKGQHLNSWTHPAIKDLACRARDARHAGNPEIIAHDRPVSHRTDKPRTKSDTIWRLALEAAEAERRRDEGDNQWEPAPLRIAGGAGPL